MEQLTVFDVGVDKWGTFAAGDILSPADFDRYKGNTLDFKELEGLIGGFVIRYDPTTDIAEVLQVISYIKEDSILYEKVRDIPEKYKEIYKEPVISKILYDLYLPQEVKNCYIARKKADSVVFGNGNGVVQIAEYWFYPGTFFRKPYALYSVNTNRDNFPDAKTMQKKESKGLTH